MAETGCSRLEIFDVAFQCRLAAISNRPDAGHWNDWSDGSSGHRFLEVLLVIFGKSSCLQRPAFHSVLRSWLETFQSLSDVGKESWFRLLAIVHDVDSTLN